jgi:hypothetical protein
VLAIGALMALVSAPVEAWDSFPTCYITNGQVAFLYEGNGTIEACRSDLAIMQKTAAVPWHLRDTTLVSSSVPTNEIDDFSIGCMFDNGIGGWVAVEFDPYTVTIATERVMCEAWRETPGWTEIPP